MSDEELDAFEEYVTEQLQNEERLTFDEPKWIRDIASRWPDFEKLQASCVERHAPFDIRIASLSPKGRVLVFFCCRK